MKSPLKTGINAGAAAPAAAIDSTVRANTAGAVVHAAATGSAVHTIATAATITGAAVTNVGLIAPGRAGIIHAAATTTVIPIAGKNEHRFPLI